MKKIKNIFAAIAVLAMASCASDGAESITPAPGEKHAAAVEAHISEMAFDEPVDDITRSSLSFGSSGMVFSWETGDKLKVFSDEENGSAMYTLSHITDGGHTAGFNGGGFSLIEKAIYYAFTPFSESHTDKKNIEFTYAGQRQTENSTTEHLGEFDFNIAKSRCNEAGYTTFYFKHLGTVAMVRMKVKQNTLCKKVTLTDSQHRLYQPARVIDLTEDGENVGDDYTFSTKDLEPYVEGTSKLFTLDLGERISETENAGFEVEKDRYLVCYFDLPPTDLSGGTMTATLEAEVNGIPETFYTVYQGKNMLAGKAYAYTGDATQAGELQVNIYVDKMWENGNVQTQTRAAGAGDPGEDKDLPLPTFLYKFIVKDNGTIMSCHHTDLSDVEGESWTKSSGMYRYTENIKLTGTAKASRIYAVASRTSISELESFNVATGTEDQLKARTMTLTNASDIRDIYVSVWSSSNFTGTVVDPDTDTPHADVICTHMASKVDIKWNSATALSGKVSVNNTQTEGLSIFQPTTNSGSGTYSPSKTINDGNKYNGRAVFYVAQPSTATYNVTVGTEAQNITFTPDALVTGWFRGHITVE